MTVDIIYLAWNRLAFTKQTFRALALNTNWDLVRRLIVYEDGSTDGTRSHLEEAVREVACGDVSLCYLGFGSPVATMNHYIAGDPAHAFAKIDSDIAVPTGWLEPLIGVMETSDVELLGMQAGMGGGEPGDDYTYEPSSHIGGVGLMRASAFLTRDAPHPDGRFGFTSWQQRNDVTRGWITPDIMCPQLDLIPAEPYRSLAVEYEKNGWQRHWPPYSEESHEIWDWLIEQEAAE